MIRDPAAPPCDSLAEGIVLSGILMCPETIDAYDLGPLLVFPEHRWLWTAMVHVHMRQPELRYPGFYVAWLDELKETHPQDWHALSAILDTVYVDEARWRAAALARDHARYPEAILSMADYDHDFTWWLCRLTVVRQARRGIEAANEIAQRWWLAPDQPFSVQEAFMTLERAVGRPDIEPGLAGLVLQL